MTAETKQFETRKKEIITSADQMMEYIQREKKIRSEKCAKNLKIPLEQVEEWADVLEEEGLINVEYSPLRGMILKSKGLPKKRIAKKMEKIKWKKKPKKLGLIQRLKMKFARPGRRAKKLKKTEEKILKKLEESYDLLDEIAKKQKKLKKKKLKESKVLEKKKKELRERMEKMRKQVKEIEKAPRKEIKKRRFFEFMSKAEKRAERIRKETDEFTKKVEEMERRMLKHKKEH